MTPRIAWIGLGNMGRGMSTNLVRKASLSRPLILFNRTASRAEQHAATLGDLAAVAPTLESAITDADIIFTSLGSDSAVTSTLDFALSLPITGKLFVETSTVAPSTASALASRITAAGASYVSMPVFGAPPMADAGVVVCVLAGPAEAVARVKPYAAGVIGRANIDLSGQDPGQALLLKVLGNTFIFGMIETLGAGLVAAEKTGLGVGYIQQFVNLLFPGPMAMYAERMVVGTYWRKEPLGPVDVARKDAGHALALAEGAGARLPVVELAEGHLRAVKEYMGERGDIAGIYGALRQEAGLKFENE
ncbi:6-phosphogluconate dehydrogenase [Trichodelitschia bisporula]|uniref:6-phosphogluconate dehydrogenase n=1 Tax=Trichodelitschia bisporula TaxID=703511 RepID=A0A6G1I5Q7_9PEZI|nr:6-phosphogluconate dehydrogenase [Trichodelitschia bisporula]